MSISKTFGFFVDLHRNKNKRAENWRLSVQLPRRELRSEPINFLKKRLPPNLRYDMHLRIEHCDTHSHGIGNGKNGTGCDALFMGGWWAAC